jgi:hypothetical protein
MEKHVCEFNDKVGLGDKEESFIEQGHQVGKAATEAPLVYSPVACP